MDYKDFIDKKYKYVIIGVSEDTSKWGRRIFNKMLDSGYDVVPVNPKYDIIGSEKCYKNLKEIPEKIDVVITVVPPKVTDSVVQSCKELGINKVWMQEGSESKEAIEFCEKNGIECMNGACLVVDGMKSSWE